MAHLQAFASDCLQLDVTGTAHFFGGESGLARTATWTLAARGLHARVAIADTPTASWAAVRHTAAVAAGAPRLLPQRQGRWLNRQQRWVVVPPGQQRQLLAGLPLTALRLPVGVVETLADVGVDSIGQLLQLSRASLRQRFDRLVTLRLAAFLGEMAEPLQPPDGDALPTVSHAFDLPVLSRDLAGNDLPALCDRLVRDCLRPLAAVGKGVAGLQMRLDGGSGRPPTVIDVGLFRPAASAVHLVELIMLRLSRTRLPRELAGLTVEVVSAAPLPCRQQLLFGTASPATLPQAGQQVAGLLDRLASRLGREAVVEPQPLADAQPEAAWAAVPATSTPPAAVVCPPFLPPPTAKSFSPLPSSAWPPFPPPPSGAASSPAAAAANQITTAAVASTTRKPTFSVDRLRTSATIDGTRTTARSGGNA